MKFNIEVELDWIGEDASLDSSVQRQIIDTIVSELREGITKSITDKVITKMDNQVEKLVNQTYNEIINKKIKLTNKWGEIKKEYKNAKEMIKERFDNWLTESVDENGKPTTSSYGKTYLRMNYFIEKELTKFSKKFTEETVKEMRSKLESTLTNDMKELLGEQMMNVIGVKDLLEASKQKALK